MKTRTFSVALLASIALGVVGCSSSDSGPATAEQKKAFAGSAPPADYMNGVNAGAEAAKKAAAEAAAKNAGR